MRGMQGSFGQLHVPLEIKHTERQVCLLETCVRMHNLRAHRVGMNQIRTVYMKEWCATQELDELWRNFESMLFSEQCSKNQVSNYHVYADYDD